MIEHNPPAYLAIVGPTASGKSRLALAIASEMHGEIVNCDSIQFYREFDIGSAKPTLEERAHIPHHGIDLFSWRETFDASQYQKFAREEIAEIAGRGKLPIVVGGSGLYFRALVGDRFDDLPSNPILRASLQQTHSAKELYEKLQKVDPTRAKEIHPNDEFRTLRALEVVLTGGKSFAACIQDSRQAPFPPACTLYLQPDKALLETQIQTRVEDMLRGNWIHEVRGLLQEGCPLSAIPMSSIGYKQMAAYIHGTLSEAELASEIFTATRRYAKKQRTWFRQVKSDLHLRTVSFSTWKQYLLPLISEKLQR